MLWKVFFIEGLKGEVDFSLCIGDIFESAAVRIDGLETFLVKRIGEFLSLLIGTVTSFSVTLILDMLITI